MVTRVTNLVTELNDEAECGEGGFFEERAIPFLRRT